MPKVDRALEYLIHLPTHFTMDAVPVVYPTSFVSVQGIDIPIELMTSDQFQSFVKYEGGTLEVRLVQSGMTLMQVLQVRYFRSIMVYVYRTCCIIEVNIEFVHGILTIIY
jgi:hypothetical protein